MGAVFKIQFAKDRRKPFLLITMMALAVLATVVFAGGSHGPVKVAVIAEGADGAGAAAVNAWLPLLNADRGELEFVVSGEKQALERVKRGQLPAAVVVTEQNYRLIAASDSPTVDHIERYVQRVFMQELQIRALSAGGDAGAMRESVQRTMMNPPVRVAMQTADGEPAEAHPMQTQLLFAFTLLVAMFTAGFKVNGVTNDKVAGIWNRLILSPVTKTGMYLGYLLYSFCVTFVQIFAVLVIFRYVLHYELGERFGLLAVIAAVFAFAIISLAMFVTGFVSKPEQFYAIYTSVIPLIPLISGAYMPPGMLDLPVLQFIADLFPMAHAMDAFLDVAAHDAGWSGIWLPVSIMLLLGIVYMGIGINLVERRR